MTTFNISPTFLLNDCLTSVRKRPAQNNRLRYQQSTWGMKSLANSQQNNGGNGKHVRNEASFKLLKTHLALKNSNIYPRHSYFIPTTALFYIAVAKGQKLRLNKPFTHTHTLSLTLPQSMGWVHSSIPPLKAPFTPDKLHNYIYIPALLQLAPSASIAKQQRGGWEQT